MENYEAIHRGIENVNPQFDHKSNKRKEFWPKHWARII